jgi:preprotein translocase subunit SecY
MAAALNIRLLGDFFHRGAAGGMLRLYDFFVAGGLSRGSVLALGVMPYLSARMFRWLAGTFVPAIRAMEKHTAGQRTLNRWTRGVTVGIALVQSYGYARFLQGLPGAVSNPGAGFIPATMLVLTASSVFAMWLAEQVTGRDDDQQPVPVHALRDAVPDFGAPRSAPELAALDTPRP